MANLIFDKAQIETAIDKIVDRTMRTARCRMVLPAHSPT